MHLDEFVREQYDLVLDPRQFYVVQGEEFMETDAEIDLEYHLIPEEEGTGAYFDEQLMGNLAELYNDLSL